MPRVHLIKKQKRMKSIVGGGKNFLIEVKKTSTEIE
jgi:hypothetical protein